MHCFTIARHRYLSISESARWEIPTFFFIGSIFLNKVCYSFYRRAAISFSSELIYQRSFYLYFHNSFGFTIICFVEIY